MKARTWSVLAGHEQSIQGSGDVMLKQKQQQGYYEHQSSEQRGSCPCGSNSGDLSLLPQLCHCSRQKRLGLRRGGSEYTPHPKLYERISPEKIQPTAVLDSCHQRYIGVKVIVDQTIVNSFSNMYWLSGEIRLEHVLHLEKTAPRINT